MRDPESQNMVRSLGKRHTVGNNGDKKGFFNKGGMDIAGMLLKQDTQNPKVPEGSREEEAKQNINNKGRQQNSGEPATMPGLGLGREQAGRKAGIGQPGRAGWF